MRGDASRLRVADQPRSATSERARQILESASSCPSRFHADDHDLVLGDRSENVGPPPADRQVGLEFSLGSLSRFGGYSSLRLQPPASAPSGRLCSLFFPRPNRSNCALQVAQVLGICQEPNQISARRACGREWLGLHYIRFRLTPCACPVVEIVSPGSRG